jgi:integrase
MNWWNKNMKTVQPIKDKELIKDIYNYLEKKRNKREYMLFYLGINVGLRISDLVKLKIYEVRNKDYIYLREKKTGKEKYIPVFSHVKKEIEKYLVFIPNDLYLFQTKWKIGHIGRKTAYYILKRIQNKFQLEDLGTHTLRKTFGYHFYNDTKDIATLMLILNHSSQSTTMKYIGMSQERINQSLIKWGGIKR